MTSQCKPASSQAIKQLFDGWATTGKDERAARDHAVVVFPVLDALEWRPTDAFLDIGCGNGYTVRHVAPRIPQGTATGLDFSAEMLAKAQRMTQVPIPTTWVHADFTTWEPRATGFDKIFSMEAFYYFSDVAAAIRKVASLLRPEGTFTCVIDYYTENAASADWPSPAECGVPMQRYTMAEWMQMFRDAGLMNVTQQQVRYPADRATEAWQRDVGSLVTSGHRNAVRAHAPRQARRNPV